MDAGEGGGEGGREGRNNENKRLQPRQQVKHERSLSGFSYIMLNASMRKMDGALHFAVLLFRVSVYRLLPPIQNAVALLRMASISDRLARTEHSAAPDLRSIRLCVVYPAVRNGDQIDIVSTSNQHGFRRYDVESKSIRPIISRRVLYLARITKKNITSLHSFWENNLQHSLLHEAVGRTSRGPSVLALWKIMSTFRVD